MYILANTWFTTLIRQFFFSIDKIVFGFISQIYDLLILIARTSVLSQSDILDMVDRIYKLLAVFMIFKVTLSLIGYVVNPDDFSDKSKGVSKLGVNIIISLALLILNPYIFNLGYRLQTIILEDNALATVIFGDKVNDGFLNSAGDQMAFTVMTPFYTPNLSIEGLDECVNLVERYDTGLKTSSGETIFKSKITTKCEKALEGLFKDTTNVKGVDTTDLNNYVAGMYNSSLGLMFRQELATATYKDTYIMDYKYIFSTVIGVIVCLLLITFCMDVGVRSIKLAFLQLVAPIPIISYVDPKSGKEGLFKKWYQMCFKTYISLFVRLLTIYFAVYIISLVADMKLIDIVDGSYVSNMFISIFIIIGALMFAKQLPKILEGLGIKLDGDGKFTLNPLKKFEEGALGGKKILGAGKGLMAGTVVGAAGMLTGAGAGRMLSGMYGGVKSGIQGKKMGEIRKDQATKNAEMRRAIASGSTFWGRRGAQISGFFGTPGKLGDIEHDKIMTQNNIDQLNADKKIIKDKIAPKNALISNQQAVKSSVDGMESFVTGLIEGGKANDYSTAWKQLGTDYEYLKNNIGKNAEYDIKNADGKTVVHKGEQITNELANTLNGEQARYSKKVGRKAVMNELLSGQSTSNGGQVGEADLANFQAQWRAYEAEVKTYNESVDTYTTTASPGDIEVDKIKVYSDFSSIHDQAGELDTLSKDVKTSIKTQETAIKNIETEIESEQIKLEEYNAQEKKAKSNVEAVHSTPGGPANPDEIIPPDSTVGRRTEGPGSGRGPVGPHGGPGRP